MVGDRLRLGSTATPGGYSEKVVTTAGYYAAKWTNAQSYTDQGSKLGNVDYITAALVRPTDNTNLNIFQRVNFGSDSVEPTWSSAPNVGDIVGNWRNIVPIARATEPPAPLGGLFYRSNHERSGGRLPKPKLN
jgi:hypothetical protein